MLKKLRDTSTFNRLTGSRRPWSATLTTMLI